MDTFTVNAPNTNSKYFHSDKGLHIIYRGYGARNIYKKLLKKVLAPFTTPAKRFLSRMLKKFLYLNGNVLLLFNTH